ncbi:hypothetical protein [Sphingobacterium bambusae]|nr:hypothetical protein [Sphingobacterium bambusae]WPL49083.1 hypothetical protein SCB77_01215 [Sphingobacterium bambusae]
MKHRQCRLLAILLFFVPFYLHANMAQPYFEGSHNAALYGHKNCSVLREVIDIDVRKDSLEDHLYTVFKVHYHLQSNNEVDLPLLFLALSWSDTHVIKVNGKTISHLPLTTANVQEFPFITKGRMENKEQFYQAAYSKNESITVKLKDLLYFKAPLHKGTNDIYIEYRADFGFQTYGFLKNYRLKYSLYPSKFWQSFGPIAVNLHLNGLAEITQSNLGKAKIENDVVKWQLSSFDNNLDITINHRTNLLGKALLLIQPIGMATLAFIGLSIAHAMLFKRFKRTRNWIFWLGIFVLPALFYTIFLFSYDVIDHVLGYSSRHGYVFLSVVTYPLLVIVYGLLFAIWKRKHRNNESPILS